MFDVQTIETSSLGDRSYLVDDGEVAVVIDPQRDIDRVLDLVARRGVRITHVSLFDKSNEGIACEDRPAFSVQYHPESSPGPSDSHHLFERFVTLMEKRP